MKATYKLKLSKEEKMASNTINILRPGESTESYYYGIARKIINGD